MTGRLVLTAVAFALSASLQGQPPATVFRSGVDVVSVPVSVKQKNRPVSGLTAADFQVLDNGVAQQLTSTLVEVLPVDVTLVLDTSGSLRAHLADLKSEIQQIADVLQSNDRVRLIAFANTVADVFGLQPAGSRLPLERLTAGGGTSFYNALAAALMALPDTDRPQLVFGFSDGLDNVSFLDADRVVSLAGRTSASLYIGLVAAPAERRVSLTPYEGGPNRRLLREAVARTGGAFVEDSSGTRLSDAFGRVLEEFRTSYMLTYTPRGVGRTGWHDIAVKVTRPGKFDIRARRGYEGG
jgi:VWFA-related protein